MIKSAVISMQKLLNKNVMEKREILRAWREEDINISPVERTCRELKKIMNTIYSNLQVEMEHAEMFEDKTLPTLDFRLFVQDNMILYSFFQKPVANKCVIHKQSALGENSKIASHTQNCQAPRSTYNNSNAGHD